MPTSASGTSRRRPRILHFAGSALVGLAIHASAASQTPTKPKSPFGADTVVWSVSGPAGDVIPGAKIKLAVKGAVVEGWHIYAPEQGSRGPIPLSVDVDKNAVAAADGEVIAAAPVKAHDKSFGFETQYYDKDFTVEIPVRIDAKSATGPQEIPVSVYFQSCNGKVCHPPKSVSLSAPITVKGR